MRSRYEPVPATNAVDDTVLLQGIAAPLEVFLSSLFCSPHLGDVIFVINDERAALVEKATPIPEFDTDGTGRDTRHSRNFLTHLLDCFL